MSVVDLAGREHLSQVLELLAAAQIHRPAVEARHRAPAVAAEYAAGPPFRLWGIEAGSSIVALAGVQHLSPSSVILRDLAVAPAHRRIGHGRRLLAHLLAAGIDSIEGDTLAGPLAFYEACGFTVRPDGLMPGGATKYRVAWHALPGDGYRDEPSPNS